MPEKRRHELRCFCSRRPLLAIYGVDDTGQTYVHVRIYKQQRIFGDVICYGGKVKICCRECVRWHIITFVGPKQNAVLRETTVPPEVDNRAPVSEDTPSESLLTSTG